MRAIEWIKGFIVLSFIVSTIVVLINIFVDPYDLWDEWGYNISYNERMKKAYQLQDLKPKSIILGSSRAEYGIDPNHPYFIQPAYNLAFTGATAYESELYLEKAIQMGHIKQVLLVVGYRFFGKGKKTEDLEILQYLSSKNYILFKAIFSWDSLKKSLKILLKKSHKKSVYSNLGQYNNHFRDKDILKHGGYKIAFEKSEKGYYESYDGNYEYSDNSRDSLSDFKKMLRLAYSNNIHMTIVFAPSHTRQWECLDYYLNYNLFLKWKRDIVLTTFSTARQYKTKAFDVWDFAQYNQMTNETIPTKKGQKMKYYFDASHFTEEMGNEVLDIIHGTISPYGFGTKLTPDQIDNYLRAQKNMRTKFIDIDGYRQWLLDLNISDKGTNDAW